MVSLRSNLARRLKVAAVLIISLSGLFPPLKAADWVDQWLAAQTNLTTWSANVTQVRELKSLTQPLTTEGHVWFAAPNLFRWEMGRPARTIALRQTNQMLVVYPRLKRIEQYPLNDDSTGQWRDALTLLESGFPQSREEMEKQFNINSVEVSGPVAVVSMSPRSANTRKLLKQVRIGFDTDDMMLRSTELLFADDSSLKNEFTNGVLNVALDPKLFEVTIPDNFKVTQPLSELSR